MQGRTRHHDMGAAAVHRLARETHRPIEEVQDVYERELEAVTKGAKVKTYAPVFAERRARKALARH